MNNAANINFDEINNALSFFAKEGWTEMEAELLASVTEGTADAGTTVRLVAHYRAHQA